MAPGRTVNARTITFFVAALFTGVAIIVTLDDGLNAIAPLLRIIAIGAWIILAIGVAADRVLAAIAGLRDAVAGLRDAVAELRADVAELRADIDTYGDERQSDGWIDHARTNGHTPSVSAPPTLKRIQ